jgi:hypothetical protein
MVCIAMMYFDSILTVCQHTCVWYSEIANYVIMYCVIILVVLKFAFMLCNKRRFTYFSKNFSVIMFN